MREYGGQVSSDGGCATKHRRLSLEKDFGAWLRRIGKVGGSRVWVGAKIEGHSTDGEKNNLCRSLRLQDFAQRVLPDCEIMRRRQENVTFCWAIDQDTPSLSEYVGEKKWEDGSSSLDPRE